MRGGNAASRAAFTLAEMLVVLGIIAALCGLILPIVGAALSSASEVNCRNNLRQIGAVSVSYATDHNGFLPAASNQGERNPERSPAWFFRLPPYAERQRIGQERTIFQCPAFTWDGPQHFTNACPKSYKMNARLDNVRGNPTWRLGAGRRDSETVYFIDAVAGETGMGQWGHCLPSAVDDSRHRGSAHVLFLDCHVTSVVTRDSGERWQDILRWQP